MEIGLHRISFTFENINRTGLIGRVMDVKPKIGFNTLISREHLLKGVIVTYYMEYRNSEIFNFMLIECRVKSGTVLDEGEYEIDLFKLMGRVEPVILSSEVSPSVLHLEIHPPTGSIVKITDIDIPLTYKYSKSTYVEGGVCKYTLIVDASRVGRQELSYIKFKFKVERLTISWLLTYIATAVIAVAISILLVKRIFRRTPLTPKRAVN